ncbi:very short patch repair endonuclease [Microbacterium sp. NPDC088619]|uniref:very short patch repair endonuclease n=1 Tax=Microbacterium sp. NPDC088619 TaxID=3364196 RepID=UPI00382F4502
MEASPASEGSASWASSPAARATMRANRGRDTGPEMQVRRLVHAAGLRYRVHARPERDLRRTVDMLFRRARVTVLIDGCFWHGCPEHHQPPKSNAAFWSDKISTNRARDAQTTDSLTRRGWLVLRFWEHEIRADVDAVAARIIHSVRTRSADALSEQSVENRSEEPDDLLPSDHERPVEQ